MLHRDAHPLVALFVLATLACAPAEEPVAEVVAPVPVLPAGAFDLRIETPEGTIVLDFQHGGDGWTEVRDADGELHVRTHIEWIGAETAAFHDAEGPFTCRDDNGSIEGRYHVEQAEKGWRLHLLSDACAPRRGALTNALLVSRTP